MRPLWYWEVIWKALDGTYYRMVSQRGFETESQAKTNLEAHERSIGEFLHNEKAELVDTSVVMENKRET